MGWMRANKPKLNPDKTEVLLFGSSLVLGSGCMLMLDEVVLIPKASVRSWSVLLNSAFLLDVQVVAR